MKLLRLMFKFMMKVSWLVKPALAIRSRFFVLEENEKSLVKSYPVVILSTFFQFNTEQQPMVIQIGEFIKRRQEFDEMDRIVLVCIEGEYSHKQIVEIMESNFPLVTHCVQGSISSVDSFARTFMSNEEIMKFHLSGMSRVND